MLKMFEPIRLPIAIEVSPRMRRGNGRRKLRQRRAERDQRQPDHGLRHMIEARERNAAIDDIATAEIETGKSEDQQNSAHGRRRLAIGRGHGHALPRRTCGDGRRQSVTNAITT